MEIVIGSMKTAEDMNRSVGNGASVQQEKGLEGAAGQEAEQKEMKVQQESGKKQETSYDAVSSHGDTLSISKAGKVTSSEKGGKLVNEDTEDGVVIRKESEKSEQESDVSTVNLSTYTKQELRQMYLDGDITRAEYDEEISSREMQD